MNDWIGDTTTWDPCLPYLDKHAAEWIFADLRGYGRSRHLAGPFDALQSASDIAALADGLGVPRFVIVGHSMSSIVALHLAQSRPELVQGVVLITPPPFTGGAPADIIVGAKAIAHADDEGRREALRQMWGDRLSNEWIDFKVARWREAAAPEAVAGYVDMFARVGLPLGTRPVAAQVVAIVGEVDPNPMMRPAAVGDALAPIQSGARLIPIADAGHYPMQEAPPLFAKLIAGAVTEIAAPA
ncbi:pimeloyl-ACP methyl ester carboxylesterase [Sphingopyxis sp. OAS728]|uniref:alpha/beta fold hydrolase n=1 Tax=Sphingopyxis sp. OAS728 TaxID=2663823 RepID=UPI00178BE300|nr:alpha/beta hydrolase [Sphingopyxis sp. OAS728]MBE1527995.1 pimeloyl-ACP methyl ester carboxylesterase [Sphingopyxis sp. OAS728]